MDNKYAKSPITFSHQTREKPKYLYEQVNEDGFNTRLVSKKDIFKQKIKKSQDGGPTISSNHNQSDSNIADQH